MITAYRIFKTKHAAGWSDGEGAFRFGGRWNSRGTRLLYASASLSLAALEMLVNLNDDDLLASYSYATIDVDPKRLIEVGSIARLPGNWNESPPPIAIQNIGDDWAASERSLGLSVPSAVLPTETNYLFNVNHPDFHKLKLGNTVEFRFDRRFIRGE